MERTDKQIFKTRLLHVQENPKIVGKGVECNKILFAYSFTHSFIFKDTVPHTLKANKCVVR